MRLSEEELVTIRTAFKNTDTEAALPFIEEELGKTAQQVLVKSYCLLVVATMIAQGTGDTNLASEIAEASVSLEDLMRKSPESASLLAVLDQEAE